MKKTRLSFRKSRWQKSDTNEIKPDYNNAFTVFGVLLTELANAAAAVLLTVCAVSVVNTTVSHVRCPYYVYVWLFIFSVISGFINRLTSLDTRKWVRHAINTGLLLVFLLGVFIANWQAAEHIKDGFLYVKGIYFFSQPTRNSTVKQFLTELNFRQVSSSTLPKYGSPENGSIRLYSWRLRRLFSSTVVFVAGCPGPDKAAGNAVPLNNSACFCSSSCCLRISTRS